jgi:hypothetical protein
MEEEDKEEDMKGLLIVAEGSGGFEQKLPEYPS